MDKLIEDDAFSGAVLVARDGQLLFRQAYGLSSKSYQVPNRLDAKFNIASMDVPILARTTSLDPKSSAPG